MWEAVSVVAPGMHPAGILPDTLWSKNEVGIIFHPVNNVNISHFEAIYLQTSPPERLFVVFDNVASRGSG